MYKSKRRCAQAIIDPQPSGKLSFQQNPCDGLKGSPLSPTVGGRKAVAPTRGCLRLPGFGFCGQMKWSLFHMFGTQAHRGRRQDPGSLLQLAGLAPGCQVRGAQNCWPGFLTPFERPCKLRPWRFVWTHTLKAQESYY